MIIITCAGRGDQYEGASVYLSGPWPGASAKPEETSHDFNTSQPAETTSPPTSSCNNPGWIVIRNTTRARFPQKNKQERDHIRLPMWYIGV